MALTDPFQEFKVPPALVLEFVAVFSRCEYAMKEGQYRRDARGMAAAAWLALAKDAGEWLEVPAGSELAAAVKLLSEEPPEVQTFSNGWQKVPYAGSSPVEMAVNAAVQVRHNLFHGGKHHPSAGDRDEQLVRAALVLLKAVIEAEPGHLADEYNLGAG